METYRTKRPTVPAMESLLFEKIPVLDHGFIIPIDYLGSDTCIAQAARVSYAKGTKSVSDDAGLINYLMRNHHSTPSEMVSIKLHIKLPIFVARQWIRHRTAKVNEVSARYSILDNEFYVPAPEHLAAQATDNKQGRGEVLEGKEAEWALKAIKKHSYECYEMYEGLLNEPESPCFSKNWSGLARELSRTSLSLNFYTQWIWKIDLHNLLHFLQLRSDPHAQYEIRVYADEILKIVEAWVPATYKAFIEHRKEAVTFSKSQMAVVRLLIDRATTDSWGPAFSDLKHWVSQDESGLGKREYEELMDSLKG